MATNLLGIANYIQNQGDLGRQQAFNRLAGQAYTAQPAQRNALVGQAVGIDPKAGLELGTQLQTATKAAETDHMAKLGGAARYMAQALASKNPAQIDGAWQNVRPYLQQLTGRQTPDHWDPSMEAGLYQAIATTGGDMSGKKELINVGAGGAVFDPVTRKPIYQNPGVDKPANLQVVQIPDGHGGTIQGFADPRTGQIMRATYGMPAAHRGSPSFQTQITPASPPNVGAAEQANALLDQGMSHEDVMRQLVQASPNQRFQLAVDPQTGRFRDVSDGSAQMPQAAATPTLGGMGYTPPKTADDTFAKNKAFADQLRAAGAINTSEEYQQVLTTGKVQQSDADVHLSPADEKLAQGLAHFAVLPSSLGRSKNRGALIARAMQINPDYNEGVSKAAYTYLNDLGRSSTTSAGGLVQSMNTLLEHGRVLLDANAALGGTGSQTLNRISNAVSSEFGGTAAPNFNQAVNFYSQELGKLVKGGVANEGEVRDIIRDLDPSRTPEQRSQAILQAMEFVHGRIKSIEDRGTRVLGQMAPDVSLLTKESQDILSRAYREAGQVPPEMPPPGDGKSYVQSVRDGTKQSGGQKYTVGQVISVGGKQYRVTGGDPNDPDVEPL